MMHSVLWRGHSCGERAVGLDQLEDVGPEIPEQLARGRTERKGQHPNRSIGSQQALRCGASRDPIRFVAGCIDSLSPC